MWLATGVYPCWTPLNPSRSWVTPVFHKSLGYLLFCHCVVDRRVSFLYLLKYRVMGYYCCFSFFIISSNQLVFPQGGNLKGDRMTPQPIMTSLSPSVQSFWTLLWWIRLRIHLVGRRIDIGSDVLSLGRSTGPQTLRPETSSSSPWSTSTPSQVSPLFAVYP